MRKKGVRFNNQDTSNGIRCKQSGSETAEITGGVMMGHPSCFNTDSNKISQLIFTVKNEITTATDCQQKWVGMFAVWRQPCDAFYQMTLRCFIPRQNVFTIENNFMTSCIRYVHLICHILWHYSAWVQLKNTYTIAVIARGTKNHSIRCGGTIDIQLIMTLRMLTNRPILSVLDVYSRMSQLCTYSWESYNQ